MKKVLILGVAAAQMDAILQLKEMGYETYAIARAKDGPGADAADHFEIINILDVPGITKYIFKNGIDAIYSTGSDSAMPVACKISEDLGLPYFVSLMTADTCNHKNRLREALTLECKGNIPFQVLDSTKKITVGYPAFLKPSDAQGQRGIFKINSRKDFEKHFEESIAFSREGKVIIEKYINGPEISVNTYFVNGELKFFVCSDRVTWPEYTGLIHKHVIPAETVTAETVDKIRELVKDVCKRLFIKDGPVYFQVKVTNGEPYLIEVTPRLDGCHMWKLLEKATGVNLMKLTFEHLLEGNTTELNNKHDKKPYELVFLCQTPKSYMDKDAFEIPDDATDTFYYYEDGDYVRPVNGRYDKVGYYIRSLEG